MSNHLKKSSYDPLLNSTFRVTPEPGKSLDLVLDKVSSGTAVSEAYESFSIEFKGPRDVLLPQQLYELTHEKLGTFSLFLVPVAEDQEGYFYQAIINREKTETE